MDSMKKSDNGVVLSVLFVLGAFLFSFNVFAISAVQKAKAEAQLKTSVNQTKAACGSATLDATIDWASFEKLSATDKDQYVNAAGQYSSWGMQCLAMICSDKDYKAEAAKITKYVAIPEVRQSSDGLRPKFAKDGETLKETFKYNGGNNGGCDLDLKKLF
jgi:hypothetical protein